MLRVLSFFASATAAIAQSGAASIEGTLIDAKSKRPIPAALVFASRIGLPPFRGVAKSGGDGVFQIEGLPAGSYLICVQAAGDQYLDPCQWDNKPPSVTLASAQKASGVSIKVAASSEMTVQVEDGQKVMTQPTKDGRRPDLSIGVWGPDHLYHPAHAAGSFVTLKSGNTGYNYKLGVPRDTALKLTVNSHDLKLGDATGAALTGNASEQAFQHATGDPNAKKFSFSVLGRLP